MNILVFAPHPDDDVLGCGGSIIKHAKAGKQVSTVFLTSGEQGDKVIPPDTLMKIREKEAREACGFLGVTDSTFLHLPDGKLTNTTEAVKLVYEQILQKKPDTIYLPHKNDGHKDHQSTHSIVIDAIKAYENESSHTPNILAYEVWTPISTVTYVENITDVMDIKLRAMSVHASQLKNVPYDEAIKGLNRYRGALTQKGTYVECFEMLSTLNC